MQGGWSPVLRQVKTESHWKDSNPQVLPYASFGDIQILCYHKMTKILYSFIVTIVRKGVPAPLLKAPTTN